MKHNDQISVNIILKDYRVINDRKNVFDQPVKNNLRAYDSIWKYAAGQGHDYRTDCLFDYNHNYLKNYYKMITIDLRKQQALDADSKAIQEINFAGNIDWAKGRTRFAIIKEAKQTILNFSQGTVRI